MITMTRQVPLFRTLILGVLVLLLFTSAVPPLAFAEMEAIDESDLRTVTGREGFDLRFNLELGSEFNSNGENLHLNIRDHNPFGGVERRSLSLIGIWLTLGVGTSSGDAIAIDTVNTSPSALQFSMGNNDVFEEFEGEISDIRVKNSQIGGGGTSLLGININDGSFGAGTLDFDGQFQVWGASP